LEEKREARKKAIEELLLYYKTRLSLLEKYRNMNIDKEILDCINEINRLKQELKKLLEGK